MHCASIWVSVFQVYSFGRIVAVTSWFDIIMSKGTTRDPQSLRVINSPTRKATLFFWPKKKNLIVNAEHRLVNCCAGRAVPGDGWDARFGFVGLADSERSMVWTTSEK